MLIFPAIDLREGRCVRLAQGDYAREQVYSDDPAAVAAEFESQGARWLHVVDLDAARSGGAGNDESLARILAATRLDVQFGGGVRGLDRARKLLEMGVRRVVLGTGLVRDPAGAEAIFADLGEAAVAGIDSRGGRVAVAGWQEEGEVEALDLLRRAEAMGARRVILTDIGRDGMLTGPNLELLRRARASTRLPIVQSGGVSTLADILALRDLGEAAPEGAIVGRALYEGRFTLAEALAAAES